MFVECGACVCLLSAVRVISLPPEVWTDYRRYERLILFQGLSIVQRQCELSYSLSNIIQI